MKSEDEELRGLLEWLGMRKLMADGGDDIEISCGMLDKIIAILSATRAAKAGRPKHWKDDTEIKAIYDMLNGAKVNELARAIAKETGQKERSAGRRLRALKKTPRFRNWIAGKP